MMVEPEKQDDNDDRVICKMDVEGMPQRGLVGNFMRPRRKQAAPWPVSQSGQLTRSEARRYTWYSILAGLLVVFVYAAAVILFVLFCTHIWFR